MLGVSKTLPHQISKWHSRLTPPLPVTGEILANPLLVVPQQPVEGQHVAITNKGQAMIDRVTGRRVRSYVQEKPAVEKKKKSTCLGYIKKTLNIRNFTKRNRCQSPLRLKEGGEKKNRKNRLRNKK